MDILNWACSTMEKLQLPALHFFFRWDRVLPPFGGILISLSLCPLSVMGRDQSEIYHSSPREAWKSHPYAVMVASFGSPTMVCGATGTVRAGAQHSSLKYWKTDELLKVAKTAVA